MAKEKKGSRWFRRFGILIGILLLALLSLSFLVHIPAIQTWGIQQISTYVSHKTETKVSVRRFDFNIFKHFELNDFFVAAPGSDQDTLIYSRVLNVRFSQIWTLTRQKLLLKQIHMEDARLNFVRSFDSDESDLTLVMNRLFNPDTTKIRKDGRLLILADRLTATNLHLTYRDGHHSSDLAFDIPDVEIDLESVDFGEKQLVVQNIHMERPFVSLTSFADDHRLRSRVKKPDSSQWELTLCNFSMDDGNFAYTRPWAQSDVDGMNYDDLELGNLQFQLNDFWMQGLNVRSAIDQLAFTDKSGFELTHLSSHSAIVTRERIALGDFQLSTENSSISGALGFSFDDINAIGDFATDVTLDGVFTDGRIWVADLLQTIPTLNNSDFFLQNALNNIYLKGEISGPINRLRGEAMQIELEGIDFRGSFKSRNLAVQGEQILNLEIAETTFDNVALVDVIPGVSLPPQFDALGEMRFTGRFDGFFQDFVAFGDLQSELGEAKIDMRLNLTPGRTLAEYSGGIELIDFDLQRWTGNPDLGRVTLNAHIREGRGVTPESANATLTGDIQSLVFKNYTYRNARMEGLLDKNFFDGTMQIADDHVDITFNGSLDFRDSIPAFDFEANIAHLDLMALNLTVDTNLVKGIFDIKGSYRDLNSVFGTATASKLSLHRSDGEGYRLDTVNLDVREFADGRRRVALVSDYGRGVVEGEFDLRSLYPQLSAMLHEAFPDRINAPGVAADSTAVAADLHFDVVLNDSRKWLKLLGLADMSFRDVSLTGVVNVPEKQLTVAYYFPELHLSNFNIYEIDGELHLDEGLAKTYSAITALDFKEDYFFDDIIIDADATNNTLDWHFQTEDLFASVNKLDIRGSIRQDENDISHAHIVPVDIFLFNEPWTLNTNNNISWGNGMIDVDNFVLKSQSERIALRSQNSRGLILDVDGFDMHYLDELWIYDKLDFAGPYSLTAISEDIFQKSGFHLWVSAPDFRINDTTFGTLTLDATMPLAGNPVDIVLRMDKPGAHLHADGTYYPPLPEVPVDLQNSLDLGIRMDTFPLDFLEFLLDGGIKDTRGSLVGDVRLFGPMSDLDLQGELITKRCSTTVTYLGSRYHFDEQSIRISKSFIDMSGAEITDIFGNTALISGGLTHKNTKNLGLSARITSPKLMALNTTKDDNTLYYGQGIGVVDARFSGPIQRPQITVDATAMQGSHVYIAVDDEEEEEREETFLRFVNKDSTVLEPVIAQQPVVTGMNFDMNLSMTPDAQVEIIFNERSEDIIKVNGEGSLQLEVTRTGEFTMYGAYEIEEGDYLFTNFVLNKPFEINRGGILRWTGDPYDAQIDLEAEYSGIRTSLKTFLEEYLVNASTSASDASVKTPVLLKMFLTGSLLEPEINFDIKFPELTGEIAGYADSKLRILRTNDNAMNEQVFGLLWAGTFLPSNVLQSDNTTELAGSGIYNTLSEFLSNQLSLFLSEMLEQAVADVDFISGIDFDVGYSQDFDFNSQNYSASEWELRLKNRLFDDRIILDVGGNYITDSPVAGTYFAGDYALEYVLTRDRRLKVRFYHRNERTIEGQKNKVGIGLSYRREFDSFGEWLTGLDKEAKKLKKSSQPADGPAQ